SQTSCRRFPQRLLGCSWLLTLLRSPALFAHHGLHARDAAADFRKLIRLRRLARSARHAEIELLAAKLDELLLQIRGRLLSQFFRVHCLTCSDMSNHELRVDRQLGSGQAKR